MNDLTFMPHQQKALDLTEDKNQVAYYLDMGAVRIQDDGIVVLKGLDFPGITGILISGLKTGLKDERNGC